MIAESLAAINDYMQNIHSANDFIHLRQGRLYLDAITLRLQVIGENVKQIETVYPGFFAAALGYNIDDIIRFRDFVSHHYERLDYQIIYDTCVSDLSLFAEKISRFLNEK